MVVGEEEEQEQGEEQVVKRRIAVSKMPTSSGTSGMIRLFESYFVPVKVNTMRVAIEKRMLREVAFTEKVISTSFCES